MNASCGAFWRTPPSRIRPARPWSARLAISLPRAWMKPRWRRPAPVHWRQELSAIGALKSVADFPEFLAREHAAQDFGMLFSFSSSQDYADSSREIAFAGAGGLGLPDRDYYTKTDAKSEEIRQKYVAHVARMLALAGRFGGAIRPGSADDYAHRNGAGESLADACRNSATRIISFTRWTARSCRR